MAALIEGFEYDIFISYRQNDNRYDGWVTEFVANLKKELKATFKEDVNVYFDENPHDGLLEMHHVNDSLRHKIKSLIFIPIISQTYCDPNCFAWKYEFLPFKDMASEDQFGLNIKLAGSGNVTSRIVPVRIHELDQGDKELLESTTGGPLRTLNFIFKAPGVNRPLRSQEDRPHDNQDKTYYRDQINKVANLIKEIILSIKSSGKNSNGAVSVKEEPKEIATVVGTRRRVILAFVILAVIAAFAYLLFKGNTDRSPEPINARIGIAVLPFKTIGKEEDSQYFADGVMDVILANLTAFHELKVKPGVSVERYRDSKESILVIAQELDVQYILSGSAQKMGDDIRIIVQLIDARKDVNVWSETFIKKFKNVFDIQNQISAAVAKSLKAKFTTEIKNRINRKPTSDFEAYDLFLKAKQASKRYERTRNKSDLKFSISLLQQSLQKDDHFALGYAWLAAVKAIEGANDIAKAKDSILLLANKAEELDSTLVEANLVLSQMHDLLQNNIQALKYTYKALDGKLDDISYAAELMKRLASIYSRIGEIEKSLFLYDDLLSITSNDQEVLRLKFIPLAASGNIEGLIKLSDRLMNLYQDTSFSNLIMTHVWTDQKDEKSIVNRYMNGNTLTDDELDLLNHYIFIVADVLRENGHKREATDLVARFENQIETEDYYLQAQLMLFKGDKEQGLQLLDGAQIGWYNLSVCSINPLLQRISNEPRFKSFIKINTDRIGDERNRINQLESKSYLPLPRDFFQIYQTII